MLQKGLCILSCVLITFFCIEVINSKKDTKQNNIKNIVEKEKEIKTPKGLENEEYLFSHKTYDEIIEILKVWESKSPNLIDIGTYGKTSKGLDTYYLKVTNEFDNKDKDVVLLTACIHGNEPWSTSTMLGYMGHLLSKYGEDEKITKILDEKIIYFIPVVSPDSYGKSRRVDGVDPNRDFPTKDNPDKKSVPPVNNLRNFFLEIKPNSVLSGHTYGRVYLVPWGDSTKNNPNIDDYKKIASEMGELSNYRHQRACELYNRPIYGVEADWYHRNGAFAMVMEFGTHQRHPSLNDTKQEFQRTLDAVLYFIEESVKVEIKN